MAGLKLTTQAAYEEIRKHFSSPTAQFAFSQEVLDEGEGNGCVYRLNEDPKSPVKCAFGCLIPDELYRPDFENKSVSTVLKESKELRDLFSEVNKDFLRYAQAIHDEVAALGDDLDVFIMALDKTARRHGLEVVGE